MLSDSSIFIMVYRMVHNIFGGPTLQQICKKVYITIPNLKFHLQLI